MRRRIYIGVTLTISAALIPLGIFVFTDSYLRLFESFKDFGTSIAYYFVKLFDIQAEINPTVTKYSGIIPDNPEIPSTPTEAGITAKAYFDVFFSSDNFRAWGLSTADFITMALLIILPCILLLILIIRFLYGRCNTNHNKDTLPLRAFKLISRVCYQPIYNGISGYFRFLRRHRWIMRLWLFVVCLHLNLITILIEFFAFYFYFAVSIDVGNIFTQIRKLFMDLTTFIKVFNVWGVIILILWLFNRWRRNIALMRLRHFEARNCGFINELPIVSITCGSMGKKKTTMITDMTLSQEVMFRQKALEILQKSDMKYPYFPWIMFESELLACMEYHVVYNLATVKRWINLKRQRFNAHGNVHWQLYGYDICKYGYDYDNGREVIVVPYLETKVYFDGSHYIAIPHTEKPPSKKPRRINIADLTPIRQSSEEKPSGLIPVPRKDGKLPLEALSEQPKEASTEKPKVTTKAKTKGELFDELYKKYLFMKPKAREQQILEDMAVFFSER